MRIDSSGRILIGTTTEGFSEYDDLTISTSGHTGITIRSGTSSEGTIAFSDGTSGADEYRGLVQYNHSNNYLRFLTNASEGMRINSSGVVCIGTTSPNNSASNLQVENSGENNVYFVGNTSTSGARLILHNKNTTANSFTGVLGADGGGQTTASINFYSADNDNNEGYLTLETRPSGGTPLERMRISSSGNVGISTTSPRSLLDLGIGTDAATISNTAADYQLGLHAAQSTGGDIGRNIAFISQTQGTVCAAINTVDVGASDQTGLIFATGNSSSIAERVRIDQNGNVGIGTDSPDSVLDITSDTPLISFNSTVTNLGADNLVGGMKIFKSDASGSGTGICGGLFWRSDDAFGARTYIQFTNRQNSDNQTNTDTECMRIGGGATGNVNIGTTTVLNLGANNVTGINLLSTGRLIACSTGNASQFGRQGSSGKVIQFACQGTNDVGSIQVTTTSTTLVSGSSDRRTKKNFEDWTEDTLSLFKNLKPQKFNFKIEDDGAEKTKGYIAQDLVDSFPEAYPKNEDDGKYMFAPQGMIVYLMKAIQELEAEVAALKAA